MTTTKVRRLATSASNPRRVSRKPRANPPKKRKMSDKQIRHFGTKRQKAALKARRTVKRSASSNSHRPRTVKRSSNPAWVVTLGPAINPHKRSSKTVPATKGKKAAERHVKANRKRTRRVAARNPRRAHRPRTKAVARRRRRASNPKIVVRYRTKKRNSRKGVRKHRNPPELFGARLGSKDSLKLIGGGILGVAATKFIPTMIPPTMAPQLLTTNLGRTAVSFAAAFVSGWAVSKLDARLGQGVYFGGFMQATSVALNAFVPAAYKALGIGLGDFVPGRFAVPQNPVMVSAGAPSGHLPAPSGSRVTMSGLARAYAPAY
jgi:hypothetical protein